MQHAASSPLGAGLTGVNLFTAILNRLKSAAATILSRIRLAAGVLSGKHIVPDETPDVFKELVVGDIDWKHPVTSIVLVHVTYQNKPHSITMWSGTHQLFHFTSFGYSRLCNLRECLKQEAGKRGFHQIREVATDQGWVTEFSVIA